MGCPVVPIRFTLSGIASHSERGRCLKISHLIVATFGSAGHTMGSRFGALAQLGERLLCKQEVAGSSPAGSTNLNPISSKLRRNVTLFQ